MCVRVCVRFRACVCVYAFSSMCVCTLLSVCACARFWACMRVRFWAWACFRFRACARAVRVCVFERVRTAVYKQARREKIPQKHSLKHTPHTHGAASWALVIPKPLLNDSAWNKNNIILCCIVILWIIHQGVAWQKREKNISCRIWKYEGQSIH